MEDLREYAVRMHVAERIAHFGVFRWELATGRVRWSGELHRIYGLEPRAFDGTVKAFVDCVHPEDRQRVRESIERCIQHGSSYLNEQRIIRPDGVQRTLLARGWTVNGADGRAQAIVGVCTDITERMQAQRALGLSERRMRAILDYTPSMVAVKDLDGRRAPSARARRRQRSSARAVARGQCAGREQRRVSFRGTVIRHQDVFIGHLGERAYADLRAGAMMWIARLSCRSPPRCSR